MSMSKDEIRSVYQNAPEPATPKQIPDGSHNVAGYMHIATLSDNSTYSFELQESFLKKYISMHPSWNLLKIYRDTGNDRSALEQMIEESQTMRIDLILVKNISRLSRDLVKSIEIIRQFKNYGIGVYSVDEDLYTLDPESDTYMQLFETIAIEESRHKSAHICTHVPNHNGFYAIPEKKHDSGKE